VGTGTIANNEGKAVELSKNFLEQQYSICNIKLGKSKSIVGG